MPFLGDCPHPEKTSEIWSCTGLGCLYRQSREAKTRSRRMTISEVWIRPVCGVMLGHPPGEHRSQAKAAPLVEGWRRNAEWVGRRHRPHGQWRGEIASPGSHHLQPGVLGAEILPRIWIMPLFSMTRGMPTLMAMPIDDGTPLLTVCRTIHRPTAGIWCPVQW
jgi:hypothetical protein